MRRLAAILFAAGLMLTAASGHAAEKALLLLGDIRQMADFSYDFNNSATGSSSSREHRMLESYGFGIDYALVKPEIITGSLLINLLANQDFRSDMTGRERTSSKLGALFDIKLDAYARSNAPFSLIYKTQLNDIQRTYGGSYTLSTDVLSASWGIKNKMIPLAVTYSHSVSSTSGTSADRTFTNDTFGLHASHDRGISQTWGDLMITRDEQSGSDTYQSNQFRGTLRNQLSWKERDLERSLESSIVLDDTRRSELARTLDLQETLRWDLGRALKSSVSYHYSEYTSPVREQHTNSIVGQLQHELFKSLTTRLQVNAQDFQGDGGSEQKLQGRLSESYRKLLPRGGLLEMGGYYSYGVTDRTGAMQRYVPEEYIKEVYSDMPSHYQNLPLGNGNYDIVPGSLHVEYQDENFNGRWIDHTESVTAGTIRGTVSVIAGSALYDIIVANTNNHKPTVLRVSYSYQFSTAKLENTGKGVNAGVSLLDGFVHLYGNYDRSDEESRSGGAAYAPNYSENWSVALGLKWDNFDLNNKFQHSDSSFDRTRTIESSLMYNDMLWRGRLSMNIRNSYRWYSDAGTAPARDPDDIVSVGGTYSLPSVLYGTLRLRSDYSHYWLSTADSDHFSVGADMRWLFRRMAVTLKTNYYFNQTGGVPSDSENVGIHITRYF